MNAYTAQCVANHLNGGGTIEGRMASSAPDAESNDRAYRRIANLLRQQYPNEQNWTAQRVLEILGESNQSGDR